jgi:hypothetical protein
LSRVRVVLAALFVLLFTPSCAGIAQTPDSSRVRIGPGTLCVTAVADGARSRVRVGERGLLSGAALGWATPTPRLVRSTRDTVPVPPDLRWEVSAGRTATRWWQGALLGLVAGGVAMQYNCFGKVSFCGDQGPVPVLSAGVGALIGSAMRRERWIPASRTGNCELRR